MLPLTALKIFLIMMALWSVTAAASDLKIDSFHAAPTGHLYADMMSSQMWYFNFIDDDTGIAGVIGAGVLNPEQRFFPTGQTSAIVALMRSPEQGGPFYSWSPHFNPKDSKNFFASRDFSRADEYQFRNPVLTIKVLDPDTYVIEASITDSERSVHATLTYSRVPYGLGDPWIPWNNIQLPKLFGVMPGRATYTMYMPDARVSGTIVIKEKTGVLQTYPIRSARGYHDGYFGSGTLIPVFKWDWLSYEQENMSIQMLAPHGPRFLCAHSKENCLPRNLRVIVRDDAGVAKAYSFEKSQIQIHYDSMKIDSEYPSVPYPDHETITAQDASGHRLDLRIQTKSYLKVFYHPPKPMKDLPTYEMIGHFEGSFFDKDSGVKTPIRGDNWFDYSNNP